MKKSRCHFCGYLYSEQELREKCGSCPLKALHGSRGVFCCPNCGIELRLRSGIVDLVERLTARLRAGGN